MSSLEWYEGDDILPVSSVRSMRSLLEEVSKRKPEWVVLVQLEPGDGEPRCNYYVCRPEELIFSAEKASGGEKVETLPVEDAMGLRRFSASRVAENKAQAEQIEADLHETFADAPFRVRAVRTDGAGGIVAVGFSQIDLEQILEKSWKGIKQIGRIEHITDKNIYEIGVPKTLRQDHSSGGSKSPDAAMEILRDKMRSAQQSSAKSEKAVKESKEVNAEARITLSAETKREIEIGAIEPLDYRVELAAEAAPLSLAVTADAQPEEEIRVVTSVEGDAVEILGKRIQTLAVPQKSKPSTGVFEIKALRLGHTRVAVSFRQGGTELGAITLAAEVVKDRASSIAASGTARALSRDLADDATLELLIETKLAKDATGNDTVCYEYRLKSLALQFNYLTVRSKPLLVAGGKPAKTLIDYIQRLYDRVTPEIRTVADAKKLTSQLRNTGVSLCEELFHPEVTEALWPVRDRLKVIKLTSWEPYIPWELIRLANPKNNEIDDKFLCEYGLIRAESGKMPPIELRLDRWAYLAATYPNESHPQVGEEVSYFTHDLPDVGIKPISIDADEDAFLSALRGAAFDVLHISCHGDSPHNKIEDSRLFISDRQLGGVVQPVEIYPDQVKVETTYSPHFAKRRPLVFLNACETGRVGALLTSWGGWPKIFVGGGAGVFIGTSWPVRDKPAAAFAKAFYEALRGKETLAEAARRGRSAAKKLPDASWLAFKVYGHPRASVVAP